MNFTDCFFTAMRERTPKIAMHRALNRHTVPIIRAPAYMMFVIPALNISKTPSMPKDSSPVLTSR